MVENKNEARSIETGTASALTIRIHADSRKYVVKPARKEIGSIKRRMAQSGSIMDLTIKQIADRILAGMTIEPGVCPLSDESQDKGRKGTVKEDFTQQQMFLIDIANEYIPYLHAHKFTEISIWDVNKNADLPRWRDYVWGQFILVNTFRCRLIGLANAISVRLRYQKRQLIAFASITNALWIMRRTASGDCTGMSGSLWQIFFRKKRDMRMLLPCTARSASTI